MCAKRSGNRPTIPAAGCAAGRVAGRRRPRILFLLAALTTALTAIVLLPYELHGFDASLQGRYSSFLLGSYDSAWQNELYGYSHNSLRLGARLYPTDVLLFEAAGEISPRIDVADPADSAEGDSAEDGAGDGSASSDGGAAGVGGGAAGVEAFTGALSAGGEYRVVDFDELLYPEKDDRNNLGVYGNLDRLYGSVYLPFGDLYLGRQPISWGSAHVIHPTDILVPYGFTGLDTEEKRGVDAARLRIPIGAFGEADFGYVGGEDFAPGKSAFFARGRGYAAGVDFSLLGMGFRENFLVGIDATRAIGGAGSWVEAAWVLPDTFASAAFGELDPETELQYLTTSAGLDYNFGPKLYGYAEYHFNSAGKSSAGGYADLLAEIAAEPEEQPAYTEGAVYLWGRHYAAVGASYQLTPLLPVSSLLLLNITGFSASLSVSAEYNFTENVYIEGGAYLGIGEEPVVSTEGTIDYRSEFGAYPDLYYLAVKIYF